MPDRGQHLRRRDRVPHPARASSKEALDAYHRALGRNEVNDYLKTYCSMWIVDLARRAGQPEDPLALAYLRSADGGKWFHDLARWATGPGERSRAHRRAPTHPARRAESSFYRAMKVRSRDGRTDDAKSLWRDVIATDMMAFFEFDMAAMYLKDGAPSQPRIPKKPDALGVAPRAPRRMAKTMPPNEPPPDGSI